MGWMAGVRLPVGVRDFSLLHSGQTGSEAHSASYPMGTGGFSLGVKWRGLEADTSPPPTAEVKNGGATPQIPNTSWRGAYE
jgi:hypothetical protein